MDALRDMAREDETDMPEDAAGCTPTAACALRLTACASGSGGMLASPSAGVIMSSNAISALFFRCQITSPMANAATTTTGTTTAMMMGMDEDMPPPPLSAGGSGVIGEAPGIDGLTSLLTGRLLMETGFGGDGREGGGLGGDRG
jgi:hypothetical protein